jgi:BirA family biotin operon repressor/biotin-[acetyl-CoA-carboxylase] ligase
VAVPPLHADALVDHLATHRLGRAIELLDTCVSTNDEVTARALAGAPEGLLVVAERQTGGRGRRGRSWHSPAGENLYVSLLLRPRLPAHRASPIALLVGAALARALRSFDFSPVLKWPNDVLLKTAHGLRKVAGILAEMATEGGNVRHLVVGVGINVHGRTFPDELVARATSLDLVRDTAPGRAELDRVRLLAGFLNALEPSYDDFVVRGPTAGLALWREHALLGQPCQVDRDGAKTTGIAEDVDDSGALVIRTLDGHAHVVHAGEVTWLPSDP